MELQHSNCPVCRADSPSWTTHAELTAQNQPAVEDPKTSRKLQALMELLEDEKPTLVVSPAALLTRVYRELQQHAKLEKLGILNGCPKEQLCTLKSWELGKVSTLLVVPDVLGVDLPTSRRIIFISPMLSLIQFRQAAGRVVRQGTVAGTLFEQIQVVFVTWKSVNG